MSSIPRRFFSVQFPFKVRIGRVEWRRSCFGESIGVADNRTIPCQWIQLIPINPEIRPRLRQGLEIELSNIRVIQQWGQVPLVTAAVTIPLLDEKGPETLPLFS